MNNAILNNSLLMSFILKYNDFYSMLKESDKNFLNEITEFGNLETYNYLEYDYSLDYWNDETLDHIYLYIGKSETKDVLHKYFYKCKYNTKTKRYDLKNGKIVILFNDKNKHINKEFENE